MKISFTNQLRMIAGRHPRADIHTMLDAIGSDSRIGKKYLRAGLSYGGPCFPRDNRLLAYTARQTGLEAPLAEASDRVNQRTNEDLFEKVRGMIKKDDVVAVLGVTYKPDTYITEEAAKAASSIHRETNVTAPVLDSTRHFTHRGSMSVIA